MTTRSNEERGVSMVTRYTWIPLLCGVVAIVMLSVALATDHWLHTWDVDDSDTDGSFPCALIMIEINEP